MPELFPPELLASLSGLRIEARRVPAGGRHAEQHAREPGHGIEFRDHRAYAPGDDIRRVDWNLYRRFQKLFLRLSDELRDLPLYLLVDVSDSTWLEHPPRSFAGRQAAGIMAAISLNQLDPAGVLPFGSKLGEILPPISGKRSLPRILGFLESLEPLGTTDFRETSRELRSLPIRPGLLAVISDFYDPKGIDAVVEAMAPLRHRLMLVRLLRASDRDPTIGGDVRLEDCETHEVVDVTVSERALARYRESYAAFEEGLRSFAVTRGAGLLEVNVLEPVLPQLGVLFGDGVYRP